MKPDCKLKFFLIASALICGVVPFTSFPSFVNRSGSSLDREVVKKYSDTLGSKVIWSVNSDNYLSTGSSTCFAKLFVQTANLTTICKKNLSLLSQGNKNRSFSKLRDIYLLLRNLRL